MKRSIQVAVATLSVALCACSSSEEESGGKANLQTDGGTGCDSPDGQRCDGAGGALGSGGSRTGPIETGGTRSGMGGSHPATGGALAGMGGALLGSGGSTSGGRTGAGGVATGGVPGASGGRSASGSCVVESADDACSKCLKTRCCTEWTACLDDPTCSGDGTNDGELACLQMCVLEKAPESASPEDALADCGSLCAEGSLIAQSTNELVNCMRSSENTQCSLSCLGF